MNMLIVLKSILNKHKCKLHSVQLHLNLNLKCLLKCFAKSIQPCGTGKITVLKSLSFKTSSNRREPLSSWQESTGVNGIGSTNLYLFSNTEQGKVPAGALELPFSSEVCMVKLCTGKYQLIMAQHINAFTSQHCTSGFKSWRKTKENCVHITWEKGGEAKHFLKIRIIVWLFHVLYISGLTNSSIPQPLSCTSTYLLQ